MGSDFASHLFTILATVLILIKCTHLKKFPETVIIIWRKKGVKYNFFLVIFWNTENMIVSVLWQVISMFDGEEAYNMAIGNIHIKTRIQVSNYYPPIMVSHINLLFCI